LPALFCCGEMDGLYGLDLEWLYYGLHVFAYYAAKVSAFSRGNNDCGHKH
jgi:hypothetical protein